MSDKVELGDVAKDEVTGFTGVVMAVTYWLNGCRRITIQPQELKDGKPIDAYTFDVEQVQVVSKRKVAVKTPSGGPMPDTPRR